MLFRSIQPKSLEEILAQHTASVADRWFARLFLLKPAAIAAISLFWILTGMFTLGAGRAANVAQFKAVGLPASAAETGVIALAFFDYLLGVLVLVRAAARPMLIVMLIASVAYLVAGVMPIGPSWLDPTGSFLKFLPMLVATMFSLAILDER